MSRKPPLILITGAARSGTSMVAGVLHASGLDFGGPLVGPTPWNPRGFFEHHEIRQRIIKPLFRELGYDPRGQSRLPPRGIMVRPARIARLRKDIRSRLNGSRAYKDAKLLLLWPIFRAAFPDARWILVHRDLTAIVQSCLRTPFMRKRKTAQDWRRWVRAHELRFEDLKASGARTLDIWPDPKRPGTFREAVQFCGLRYHADVVRSALQPSAWHGAGS